MCINGSLMQDSGVWIRSSLVHRLRRLLRVNAVLIVAGSLKCWISRGAAHFKRALGHCWVAIGLLVWVGGVA